MKSQLGGRIMQELSDPYENKPGTTQVGVQLKVEKEQSV